MSNNVNIQKILIQNKKKYLVDVPVRINIWIRPSCQRLQFEVLKKARPSIIFLQSDGGRNEKEWQAIYENRKIFDNEIDWNCCIYKFYEDHNNGLYTMFHKVLGEIWKHVDRCIFLEDDQIPSVSYFKFMADLLERYKNDQRIEGICGMNILGKSPNVTSDYFFSELGSIWGTATWRDRQDEWDFSHSYKEDSYTMSLLQKKLKNKKTHLNRIKGYAADNYYEGHVAGSEFFRMFSIYSQSRLLIVPKYNMINCIGNGEDAAHTKGSTTISSNDINSLFNMETYEYEFPLKYSKYVISDEYYQDAVQKIVGLNLSSKETFTFLVKKMFYILSRGKFIYLFRYIKEHFNKKIKVES